MPREVLSRKSYRQVVKKLEEFRKLHEEDQDELPDGVPLGWSLSITEAVMRIVRNNRERYYRGMAEEVMEYLVSKGLLVRCMGDYTFPTLTRRE